MLKICRLLKPRKIYYTLLNKQVIYDYRKFCKNKCGHALLYYKIDPFLDVSSAKHYKYHSNNWQVLEIAKILNRIGYWVDIIDRKVVIDNLVLEDKYDIFIGLGAGNSGKYYPLIASKLTKSIKIFYAAGPDPPVSNDLIYQRYDYFAERTQGKKLNLRRIIDKVDIQEAMKYTDSIFCLGNEFSVNTYKKYKKDIYRINPSSSHLLNTDMREIVKRDFTRFLYFGGNGNVVKGLDILIEVFSELRDLKLYICAPREDDFASHYENLIARCPNIEWVGFVQVGGQTFRRLTSECGFVVLPSCSEGTATSVATCMRKGLIPVVTYECGVDLDDFGFMIPNVRVKELRNLIADIAGLPREDLINRSIQSYISSFNYTQASFSKTIESALIQTLNNSPVALLNSQ